MSDSADTFVAIYEVRITNRRGVWLLTASTNDREDALCRCDDARRRGLVATLTDRFNQ